MEESAAGRVVIVTGASRGIGEATARLFAGRGWSVVLAARSAERLARVADDIASGGGRVLAVPTDVTSREAVEHLVSRTVKEFGRVDAVVNNAGRAIFGIVASLDPEELEETFRLNVLAPVAVMRAVVPVMRRQGGGAIVNVSSQAENFAPPFLGAYSATKIALSYLSDSARIELAHENISVTSVLPGLTDTGFSDETDRAGSIGDFLLDERLLSGPGGGVPPERVAETIWRAVHERPRRASVSLADNLGGRVARLAPGTANRLLALALDRYVPRRGHAAASPFADLVRLGAASTAAAALFAAGRRFLGR